MEIKNKLEKLLIVISGFLTMTLVAFGIKINEDDKKISSIQDSLNNTIFAAQNTLDAQKQAIASRESLLDKIVAAPAPDMTKSVTTQVVVPGKVVPQQVPVTSTKKTKTS